MTLAVDVDAIALNLEVNRLVGIKQYRHMKQVMQEFDDRERQSLEKTEKVDRKIE